MTLILNVGIGAVLGAALGYFGQCSSGACPLTANWWRGSIYGAFLGGLFYLTSDRGQSAAINRSSANITKIAAVDFEKEVIQSNQPVLVDFYAPWCGPCKKLAPVVEGLAGQFSGGMKFVKINVDEAPELANRLGIQGVPTLLVFKNGKVVDTSVGLVTAEALKTRLESVMQ